MGGNMPKFAPTTGEIPLSVLDTQPPLPNAAPIRIVEHEDNDNQERVLVPVMPYVNKTQYGPLEESQEWTRNPLVTFFEG